MIRSLSRGRAPAKGEPVTIIDTERRLHLAEFVEARYLGMTGEDAMLAVERMTFADMAWLDLEMRRTSPRHSVDYDPFAAAYR